MAQRGSAKQLDARKKARELAATFAQRETMLQELAASYFVAADQVEDVMAATEERIDAIRARAAEQERAARHRAAADARSARASAAEVIAQMLATGEAAASVAGRLGLSVAQMRRARSLGEDVAALGADAVETATDDAAPLSAGDDVVGVRSGSPKKQGAGVALADEDRVDAVAVPAVA